MNYTVKMSEEAEDNLKAVIEYISIELKMPHAASNLYYKIKNLIQSLATMPERFKEYDKEKDIEFLHCNICSSYQTLEEGEFLVFYPQDAHQPSLTPDNKLSVKKVIVKVEI